MNKPKPTEADLVDHPLYAQLTEKQKKFIREFTQNGFELTPAVMEAYVCKDKSTATNHGKNLLRNWRIRNLCVFMGFDKLYGMVMTRREVQEILTARMRDPSTPTSTVLALYKELAEMRGWSRGKKAPAKAAEPTTQPTEQTKGQSIDDLIQQIESELKQKQ